MKPFRGIDFYEVDDLLREEEILTRDTVRTLVTDELLPVIRQHHRAGTFPAELIPKIAELGLLGAALPEKYGGSDLGSVAYGIIMQELERGDSAIRSFVSVQAALVIHPIWQFGSDEQKADWLPKLASGEAVGCFGLTEPDFGSNPAGMRARAVKKGNEWVINGSKMWITNGSIADIAVVWARTDEGIRGFLVEKGTPGFSTADVEGKLSLRASVTSSLTFEDCHIPEGNLLPESEGLKSALACLNQARYGIAWGAVGSAMACYDEALQYASTRIQFDKPIASFQLIQEKLVQMLTDITTAQLLCLQLGRLKDENRASPAQIALAKRNNVRLALITARTTRDILGASGITDEYQAARHMMNLESVYTYEGTHDIQTLIIGEDITGISAFS